MLRPLDKGNIITNTMAAAFKVTCSSDIASAFAAHDEFLSRVSMKGNGGEVMGKGKRIPQVYFLYINLFV